MILALLRSVYNKSVLLYNSNTTTVWSYIMNYTELTKGQRRCVDAFMEINPELKTANSISRNTVEDTWNIALSNRDTGGPKFAYPMWLVKGPKVSRGVYVWPAPGVANTIIKPNKVLSKEDQEFFDELRAHGIDI